MTRVLCSIMKPFVYSAYGNICGGIYLSNTNCQAKLEVQRIYVGLNADLYFVLLADGPDWLEYISSNKKERDNLRTTF